MPGVTNSPTGLSTPTSRAGENDRVMRDVGATTGDIRLTPTAATIVGGAGYILGSMNDAACGVYEISWQGAASATAEALGAINYATVEVYENTAGVYVAKKRQVTNAAGAIVADDHDMMDATAALFVADADGAADADIEFGVATATAVTNFVGVTTVSFPVAVGDLYLFDGSAASTRVYSITRLRGNGRA